MEYPVDKEIDYSELGGDKELLMDTFFDTEYKQHMVYNCKRAIPDIMDGFKVSQRKIIWTAHDKLTINSDIKLTIFTSDVIKKSQYHHGEGSLYDAIVLLAKNYITSNNINYLKPIGQFGSRRAPNSNAAPRYISVGLEKINEYLFPKADRDQYTYVQEDGIDAEPEYLLPVLPTILINGVTGVGTGWSTKIYPHYVDDIATATIFAINEQWDNFDKTQIREWSWGHRGRMHSGQNNGIYLIDEKKKTLTITEVPYGQYFETGICKRLNDLQDSG